jgi:hypothetical protein
MLRVCHICFSRQRARKSVRALITYITTCVDGEIPKFSIRVSVFNPHEFHAGNLCDTYHTYPQRLVPRASYALIQGHLDLPPHPGQENSRLGCALIGIPRQPCDANSPCARMHPEQMRCPSTRGQQLGRALSREGLQTKSWPFCKHEELSGSAAVY